jgi:Ca-activated chloride channel family protein
MSVPKKVELLANISIVVVAKIRHKGFVIILILVVLFALPVQPGRMQTRPTLSPPGKESATSAKQDSVPLPSSERAVPQDDVIRINTNMVTISASVLDRDGRFITDLQKEDFRIIENGVPQDIAYFAPVNRPFTILFLLDTSGSMTSRANELSKAVNSFVGQLREDDQLMVASFSNTFRVVRQATVIKQLSEEGTKFRLSTGGSTMLYDAVNDALKRMKSFHGRKAIVLFSDGYDSGMSAPFVTAKDNLRKAEEQEALIYTVQFDTHPFIRMQQIASGKNEYESVEAGSGYMRAIAQRTGGRHYQIETMSDLEKTFGTVADELRRQYSLGFYPKGQLEVGQKRRLKVEMRVPNLVVRARDNFVVGKDLIKR